MKIPFHIPYVSGQEIAHIQHAIQTAELSSDGAYTRACEAALKKITGASHILLTPSGTHALEMSALLCGIQPGDEVIMPSFNFVSAANAFALRGAKIVFVDIRPDTMNLDEQLLESAITEKTKAVLVMHYGGIACEMEKILDVANRHQLFVIEDAAHGIGAFYRDLHLGTLGHFGAISFHSSKNVHCSEGGALLINDPSFVERAMITREKGTNRKSFFEGLVDQYTWVDIGSSYLLGEINAAFLLAQLQQLDTVTEGRLACWNRYMDLLYESDLDNHLFLPQLPNNCKHNAHIFFVKCKDRKERKALIDHFRNKGIGASFHYPPLHTSKAGKIYGRFKGADRHTTLESQRLLRLPLYHGISESVVWRIVEELKDFFL